MIVVEALPPADNLTKSITAVILVTAIVALLIDNSCRVFSLPIRSVASDLRRSWVRTSGSLLNSGSYHYGLTGRGISVLDDTIHDAIAAPICTFPLITSATI